MLERVVHIFFKAAETVKILTILSNLIGECITTITTGLRKIIKWKPNFNIKCTQRLIVLHLLYFILVTNNEVPHQIYSSLAN